MNLKLEKNTAIVFLDLCLSWSIFTKFQAQQKMQYCKVIIGKSKSKLLSNCNRNFQSQPSGWIGWLLASCRLCTYQEHKLQQLDKKRNSPIIILLSSVWYSVRIWVPQIKNSVFWPWRYNHRHRLSHILARYEPYIDRHLIYRHRVNWCINCVLVYYLFVMILLLEAPLTFIEISKRKYF